MARTKASPRTTSARLQAQSKRKASTEVTPSGTNMHLFKRLRSGSSNAPTTSLPTPEKTVDGDSETDSILDVPGRDADYGTIAQIKTFYQGKKSNGNYNDWVERMPKQLDVKVVKVHNQFAIKVFKVKDHEQKTIGGLTPLKIHSIEVQSPILIAALKPLVKEEGKFLEASESANFPAPFKELFFCFDKIEKLEEKVKKGSLLKEHLGLLMQVLHELFDVQIAHLKHLNKSGLISYKLAWTYFPKNTMLFCSTTDCEKVCRVISTAYTCIQNRPHLQINAEEVAFDGEEFAWTSVVMYIPAFGGNMPITELPCYPMQFHEQKEEVLERLRNRAEKAIRYQELTYCEYVGVALEEIGCGVKRHNVSGRILIDYFGYKKYHDGLARNDNAGKSDQNTYIQTLAKEKQQANIDEMLGERKDDLVYVSPLLAGFALKNKLWFKFYVDDIKPVVWNDDAYGHLVYPEEQKDLVLTFVDNHQRMKAGVDDVIVGKGQGLILLLSGPPGTGKTLTAEAVADKTRRPLYYLQAEDLGTDASKLGPKIKKVFEMATEWDAVILLDEADVFMAERDPGDIARNELVSIFLRELEYYRGIIFLTTNLYSTIDTAFRSRVNIHLVFHSLPFSSRLLLWEKFLKRLDVPVDLGDADMKELAKWELNGREIKNAIKTVRTWGVIKGFEMSLGKLEAGIRVTAPQSTKRLDGDMDIDVPN